MPPAVAARDFQRYKPGHRLGVRWSVTAAHTFLLADDDLARASSGSAPRQRGAHGADAVVGGGGLTVPGTGGSTG
jgi:hypothetical protein